MVKKLRKLRDWWKKEAVSWKTYEEAAAHVLKQLDAEFGLSEVEGKQTLRGKSGAKWEIDAKGIKTDDGAVIVVECKRYRNTGVDQNRVGGLASSIRDLGAAGGIIVSPLPLQKGAALLAKANDIKHIQLHEGSSREQWLAEIMGIMKFGITLIAQVHVSEALEIKVIAADGTVIETR